MFPAAEIPASNATTAASPPRAPNPATAPTPPGIVQREPAAANSPASAAPLTQATPPQTPAPAAASSSSSQSLSHLISESSQTPPTPSRVGEVRPPTVIAYRDTTVGTTEPAHPTPAEAEARDRETTSGPPRVIAEPQPQAVNPGSLSIPSPAPRSSDAALPFGQLQPAASAQGGLIIEDSGVVEVGQAQPRPASYPEPVVPAMQPQAAPPVDAVQPAARPVEVRIGRIEVRVNSPAPAPTPVVPPMEALAARPAEGAGFEEYDGIRGYRLPTTW